MAPSSHRIRYDINENNCAHTIESHAQAFGTKKINCMSFVHSNNCIRVHMAYSRQPFTLVQKPSARKRWHTPTI